MGDMILLQRNVFVILTMIYQLCLCMYFIMRLKDGDFDSSILAAISVHVVANLIRHGGFLFLATRWTKNLSARLTAKYSVSILCFFMLFNSSIKRIIYNR